MDRNGAARAPEMHDLQPIDQCHRHVARMTDGTDSDIIVPDTPSPKWAYVIEISIREAHYGNVWRARLVTPSPDASGEWVKTDKFYAIKETKMQKVREAMQKSGGFLSEHPFREIAILGALKRNRITEITDFEEQEGRQLSPDELRSRYEDSIGDNGIIMPVDILTNGDSIFVVMPLCEGKDLFDRMEPMFSEDEARYVVKHILNGLESLQHAKVCHRDISPENIMILNGVPVIIDFGMGFEIPYDGAGRCMVQPSGTMGKGYYMSPEIFNNTEPFDAHAVDLWAVGIILYMMVTGSALWECPCQTNRKYKSASSGYFPRVADSEMALHQDFVLSDDLIDLLSAMFQGDAANRLTLDEVRAHAWMQGGMTCPWP